MHIAVGVLRPPEPAVLYLLALLACGSSTPPSPPEPTPSEQRMLEDLGYLDAAQEPATQVGARTLQPQSFAGGYGLYCHRAGDTVLIDADGKAVHHWPLPDADKTHACRLLKDGSVLVAASRPGREHSIDGEPTGFVRRMSWSGETLANVENNAHHDIDISHPETILALDFQLLDPVATLNPNYPVRADQVRFLDRDLKTTRVIDVLPIVVDLARVSRAGKLAEGHNPYINVLHLNTVQWVRHGTLLGPYTAEEPGRIIVTSRTLNRVFVIDIHTEKVVWEWGTGQMVGPHGGTILPNGHLLVLDNGRHAKRSRVLEVDPETGGIHWSYEAPEPESFFSAGRGGVRRLPNGNTLITSTAQAWVFEVDPKGKPVWEYRCPHTDADGASLTFREMLRLPASAVEPYLK